MNRASVSPPHLSSARLLSVAEVAQILSVSRKLIQSWIDAGLLPAFRVGPQTRVIRIREGDLEAFIQRHIRTTSEAATKPEAASNAVPAEGSNRGR